MAIRVDERTSKQRKTHTVLITATDRRATWLERIWGGETRIAWACKPEHSRVVFSWASRRRDVERVNFATPAWHATAKHVYIYVVNDDHPSIGRQA